MEYEMNELLPIVAKLAEKYTSKESSSITYERAEYLMEAVIYCINEYVDRIAGARSAEQSGYDYSVKKKGFFQTWRARSNQSKPLTHIVFGR